MNDPIPGKTLPGAHRSTEVMSPKIEELVTAIRLEAERRDLGTGTIVISAERLRDLMREFLLR